MSIHNEVVAVIFDEMADLLEIEAANLFRVRAYRNAARTIRSLGRELRQMVAAGEDLTDLPGIGDDLAAKIREILTTGHASALDKLHTEVPASLEELLKIPGLGPKRVKALYLDRHIQNLAQLEAAVHAGKLRELPGFGVKTEQRILESIGSQQPTEQRVLRHVARQFCYPRTEAGLPTLCAHSCVGRIRYIGVLLYDAGRIAEAAAAPDVTSVYPEHLAILLDPHDPAIAAEAERQGIPENYVSAARRSPVYRLINEWRLALPLHPEFRTLLMVWYVPPLSPANPLRMRPDPWRASTACASRSGIWPTC